MKIKENELAVCIGLFLFFIFIYIVIKIDNSIYDKDYRFYYRALMAVLGIWLPFLFIDLGHIILEKFKDESN